MQNEGISEEMDLELKAYKNAIRYSLTEREFSDHDLDQRYFIINQAYSKEEREKKKEEIREKAQKDILEMFTEIDREWDEQRKTIPLTCSDRMLEDLKQADLERLIEAYVEALDDFLEERENIYHECNSLTNK